MNYTHNCSIDVFSCLITRISAEQQRAALDAVHFITLVEQKLGKASPVLSGDTGTHARLVMFFTL